MCPARPERPVNASRRRAVAPRAPARRGARGLALIVVLWVAAVVTLLATSFSFSLRTEARLAAGMVERARAGAAAEAGVYRLMAHMSEMNVRALAPISASMPFEGMTVSLQASPENARVDLNAAPPPLLEGLVRQAAVTSGEAVPAAAVSAAIMDWRDPDDEALPEGAERREYEASGRTAFPRNGAFLSVSELSRVLGVTPALYAALAPLVTVYAWSPQVDPMSASREVLLAVPGLDASQVDAFLAQREDGAPARTAVAGLAGAERYLSRTGSLVYRLSARAEGYGGVVAARQVVVKFNANRERPVSVLAWLLGPAAAGD